MYEHSTGSQNMRLLEILVRSVFALGWSVVQAFINALPLPALDGGKALFVLAEQAGNGVAATIAVH